MPATFLFFSSSTRSSATSRTAGRRGRWKLTSSRLARVPCSWRSPTAHLTRYACSSLCKEQKENASRGSCADWYDQYGQAAKSSNGTAGSSPFASFGTPFKVPSRRILYEPEEASSSAAQPVAKLSSFALPLRASPSASFSSSDHRKDLGTDLQLPSKRHKTSDSGALQDQNPTFGKPPSTSTDDAASKSSTFSLGEVPPSRAQLDKPLDSKAVLGKRQREAEAARYKARTEPLIFRIGLTPLSVAALGRPGPLVSLRFSIRLTF